MPPKMRPYLTSLIHDPFLAIQHPLRWQHSLPRRVFLPWFIIIIILNDISQPLVAADSNSMANCIAAYFRPIWTLPKLTPWSSPRLSCHIYSRLVPIFSVVSFHSMGHTLLPCDLLLNPKERVGTERLPCSTGAPFPDPGFQHRQPKVNGLHSLSDAPNA